jgi:hypothetical protein
MSGHSPKDVPKSLCVRSVDDIFDLILKSGKKDSLAGIFIKSVIRVIFGGMGRESSLAVVGGGQ